LQEPDPEPPVFYLSNRRIPSQHWKVLRTQYQPGMEKRGHIATGSRVRLVCSKVYWRPTLGAKLPSLVSCGKGEEQKMCCLPTHHPSCSWAGTEPR